MGGYAAGGDIMVENKIVMRCCFKYLRLLRDLAVSSKLMTLISVGTF